MEINNRKVAIIGAGFVGSSIAYALTLKNLANEIILIDVDRKKAEGEALDIQHGISYMGRSSVRAGDYPDCADCDLIVVTAGRNRHKGETRLDMAQDNLKIMDSVVLKLKEYYTRGAIIIISNPVDVLTYYVDKEMGLPNGRVFGTGCILDTSRLIREVANYTGLSTEVVKCTIIGEHGDTQIPVWSRLAIAGVPMDEYCQNVGLRWDKTIRESIYSKVKAMGSTIIEDKGRTHYGIATCVCSLADAVLNQRPTIASVTTPLTGQYNINGVALSLPSIIGVNGVENKLVEYLNDDEYKALQSSSKKMEETIESLKIK